MPPAGTSLRRPLARKHTAGLVLLTAALGVQFWICMREGWLRADGNTKSGTDFTAYYSAGELAREGKNVYDYRSSSTPRRPYIYAPAFAVFPMAPLSLLPHNAALAVFWLLSIAALAAAIFLLRAMLWPALPAAPPALTGPWSGVLRWPLWKHPGTGLALAVLVVIRFLHANLKLGQVNILVLFLAALAIFLLLRSRNFWAGLLIALATAIKITPGIFGLYLLWSLRGRAMLGGALGLVLWLVLVPALLLGFSQNLTLLKAYAEFAAHGAAGERAERTSDAGAVTIGWARTAERKTRDPQGVGISLRPLVQSWAGYAPPQKGGSPEESPPPETTRNARISFQTATRIADALSLLLLAVTVVLTAPRWTRTERYPLLLSTGLLTTLMVLISPLTRKAHLVVLLIPVAVLIALLQQDRLRGAAKRWAWAALLALGLPGLIFSGELTGKFTGNLGQLPGGTTFCMLLLYAATAVALRSLKPESLTAETQSRGEQLRA